MPQTHQINLRLRIAKIGRLATRSWGGRFRESRNMRCFPGIMPQNNVLSPHDRFATQGMARADALRVLDAADRLGVSRDTYGRLERQTRVPRYIQLACAALAYGLPPME